MVIPQYSDLQPFFCREVVEGLLCILLTGQMDLVMVKAESIGGDCTKHGQKGQKQHDPVGQHGDWHLEKS